MTRTLWERSTPARDLAAAATADQQVRWRNTWLSLLTGFLMLTLILLLSVVASGQQVKYDMLPVDERIDKILDSVQREARTYSQTRDLASVPDRTKRIAETYFRRYLPAKITQLDSTHQINELMEHATGSMRSALRMQSPAAGDLMRWLYGGLKPVAMGNYLPAARINAIHFISHLDRPAARGGVPQPYPFVLKDMRQIYDDANNPDGVRAAALQGIERFVRYTPTEEIPAADRQALTQAMTDLLQADPPRGRDDLAHAFLQRYAVSILSNLSTDASIGKQFVSVSTNDSKPNLIALHSAAAVGTLPGKMAEGDVETKEVLKQWAKRILTAYQNEIDRLEAMERPTTTSRFQPPPPESFVRETKDPNERAMPRMGGMEEGMMMGEGMMEEGMMMMEDDMMMMEDSMMGMEGMMYGGMMPGMTVEKAQPAEIIASRKKLNFVLQQVLLGVTGSSEKVEDVESIQPTAGLIAATPADNVDAVKSWVQSVNDLTTNLNDTSIGTEREFIKMLSEQLESLESLASGRKATVKMYEVPMFDDFGAPANPAAEAPADGEPAAANPPRQPAAGGDAGLDALMEQ
jgi:hypothetical protein